MDFFPARNHSQPSDADAALQVQLGELRDRLAECQRDAAQSRVDMQARLQELEEQLAIRQKLNDRQRADIEALDEQLERLKLERAQDSRQHDEQMVQVKAELQDAKDIAQKRVEAVQRFKAELSLSRTTATEAQQGLTALRQQYLGEKAAWTEQRELLDARLAGYEETEAETVQRWQEEREEFELAMQERDRQMQEVLERSDPLQARVFELESQNAALRADLTTTQADSLATQSERDALQGQVSSLEERLIELEQQAQANQQAAISNEQLQAAEQHTSELEEQLDDTRRYLKQLESEVGGWKEKFASQQMHTMRLKKALERSAEEEREPEAVDVAIQAVATQQGASRSGADLPRFIR
ncbi:MAG: hypothetical protein AAGE92_08405 [Cyanobacteria bacterium P01_G01_bin.4]